ncbi:ATP-grasp peptide maturase system methyltransferase [Nonomuraea gerenzanensis]|uniref:Protein-L-isoaspartate O-methyltransferase n=1 Tax=Nonomuraea gerenzanensis TaxID=93944 RepID=A0A1M4E0C9_9ACTN|nr:ATP-grasp peptide maturase system methyltransferase [Nonomuraea gerenzanensis]UBU14549.1 ATP-grasp peptide maturase system methyltransferase [Nonomuraea gerenzanensis]SBO92265.1 Protein-L-isoaspartate O-methyltransferase [Nonomuraea gerenzanensis]
MSDAAGRLRQELAALLVEGGALTDPGWRRAVEVVPRERFLGEAVFHQDEGMAGDEWRPLLRSSLSEEEWLELAYSDQTWVTQVDGIPAEAAGHTVAGSPTSSSTMPSLVVRMLERAGIGDAEKVLEIGTGTGYSTALLCERLGDGLVTSVEYDRHAAARARQALEDTGHAPTLVTGDGLAGHDGNVEYDRLIATCSVRYIPMAWMEQVRDGGTITAPLSGWLPGHALAHLTLAEDGTASGRFLPDGVSFMPARPHARPPRSSFVIGLGDERESVIDPNVLDDATGRFVAQLGAPSAEKLGLGDEVILLDVATGSQASTRRRGEGWVVRQHGPLRLWDGVEDAVVTWLGAGGPPRSGFGLTVTRTGQRVWLGDPEGPGWSLPV